MSIIELSSQNFEAGSCLDNKLNPINNNVFLSKNSKSVSKNDQILDSNKYLNKFLKSAGKKYDEKVLNYIETFFNHKSCKQGNQFVMLNLLQDTACNNINKDFISMLDDFKMKAKIKRSTNKKKGKENVKKTQSVEKEHS